MNISLTYPYWSILICLLLGGLLTVLLYRKHQSSYSHKGLYYAVTAARFLTLSGIAFLLLSPILRYIKKTEEKPTLVFIQDNSASQKFAFKQIDSVAYRNNVKELLTELKQDFKVRKYALGEKLSDTLKFDYNEPRTDLATSLETLMQTLENENIGSFILASDGIYNKGTSPLSIPYPFKGSMYTIGLGDTTLQKDALVARVFANKVVHLGDQFVIRSDISTYACKGSAFTVSVFAHNANRVIASQSFTATDDRYSKSIEIQLDAKSAGIQHFTISISKADGEQNLANNSQDVYVEVLDNKDKILILANAPHPDVFALNEALTKNKNYKVDVQLASTFKANASDYNLIVLHNLPSIGYNATSIIDQAKKTGISLWFICGSQTAIPLFNQTQNCLQIKPRGINSTDVQAVINPDFSYFTLNPSFSVKSLPPLASPFGDFTAGPSTQILMKQQLGSVTTNYPLWLMQQNATSKIGVLAGEGLWRWRLYDYNQHKNHNLVDEYILKTAQYLAVKQDKRPFRSILSKTVFTESEPVLLDAELYNDNYELVNTPDATVTVLDQNNAKTTFTMNKEGNSYTLNMGNMANGLYSYSASTAYNGKSYTSTGKFNIIAQNIEEVNTTADFGLLNDLAKTYGGEFVFANQVKSLREKIKANPNIKTTIRSNISTEPLINWKWLFGLFIVLLSLEWFIRKRNGNY